MILKITSFSRYCLVKLLLTQKYEFMSQVKCITFCRPTSKLTVFVIFDALSVNYIYDETKSYLLIENSSQPMKTLSAHLQIEPAVLLLNLYCIHLPAGGSWYSGMKTVGAPELKSLLR